MLRRGGSVGRSFLKPLFPFEKTFFKVSVQNVCHCFTWYYKISHCLSANHNLEFVTLFALVLHFCTGITRFALLLHFLYWCYMGIVKSIIYTRNIFYCNCVLADINAKVGLEKKFVFKRAELDYFKKVITQLKRGYCFDWKWARESISWQAVFLTQEKNKNIKERQRAKERDSGPVHTAAEKTWKGFALKNVFSAHFVFEHNSDRRMSFLNFKHSLDRSVQGRKAQTGYTALNKAPTHEIQKTEPRPDHNTGNSMPYSFRDVCGFFDAPC